MINKHLVNLEIKKLVLWESSTVYGVVILIVVYNQLMFVQIVIQQVQVRQYVILVMIVMQEQMVVLLIIQ